MLNFHDFPGLENQILKFHDFPGFHDPYEPCQGTPWEGGGGELLKFQIDWCITAIA